MYLGKFFPCADMTIYWGTVGPHAVVFKTLQWVSLTQKSALQVPSGKLVCPPSVLQKCVVPSSLEGTALQTEKPELSALSPSVKSVALSSVLAPS